MAGNKAGEDPQVTKHEQLKAEQNATKIAKDIATKEKQNQYFAKKEEQAKQEAQIKEQAMQDLKNRQAENKKLTDDSVLASFLAANGKSSDIAPAFGEVATYQEYFNRLKNGNSIDNNIRLNQERRDQIDAEKASTGVNDVSATKDKLNWIKNKMKKKIDIQVTEAPKSMKAQLEREAREMASYKPFEILE